MKFIDGTTLTCGQRDYLIRALEEITSDRSAQIEDENGNPIARIKLFERKLSDGSSYPVIELHFDKD